MGPLLLTVVNMSQYADITDKGCLWKGLVCLHFFSLGFAGGAPAVIQPGRGPSTLKKRPLGPPQKKHLFPVNSAKEKEIEQGEGHPITEIR